ncbi:uncharacterized protein [Littorina saxatilis]|uniref:Diphthine--ammonia ligase n=1 Tax=Littorina saxatilis TaxID=31220 RepID=A0AAN9BFT9_9CAEN
MKTVALISGGKDSCFNMLECVAEGHQIVALANLRPKDKAKDELDSYMYQTVGHQAIELYAEAMALPLYRHNIQGTALDTDRDYLPQEADEVEDLYQLLSKIQGEMEIEAVAVGAILSDYQRVRVESVCLRLGLTPLAYLWRREQAPLLQEMVDCGVEAILIKVAAMGLEPERHLGLSLQQILPYMLKMEKQYGLNVCGEGGEYETFTLDCPLFKKKLVVNNKETVIHSADAFAPVGYIHFNELHLEDKGDDRPVEEIIRELPLTSSHTLMETLRSEVKDTDLDITSVPTLHIPFMQAMTDPVAPCSRARGNYFSVGGVVAVTQGDLNTATSIAMEQFKGSVEALGRKMSDLFSMCVYVNNMSDFAAVNAVYKTYFGINPPVRICVGASLPQNVVFCMDCQGWGEEGGEECSSDRRTMHVQGISHWAPANIGPYSQATVLAGQVFIAGQIPLVPGTMQLVSGSVATQCRLSLKHTLSVLQAMCPGRCLRDVLLCVCYVTHPDVIPVARGQWETMCAVEQDEVCLSEETSHRPTVEYVVVPSLPRAASVEWQVYSKCQHAAVQGLESTCNDGKFRVHTRCLRCVDTPVWFTTSTHVYLQDKCGKELDADAAAAACLKCYTKMLGQLNKGWGDVPLLRIFYPAQLCSYTVLSEAWRRGLGAMSDSTVTFSLVPVVQLADDTLVMLLCH